MTTADADGAPHNFGYVRLGAEERPFAHLELDELVAAVTAVADAGDLESVALTGPWRERVQALVAEAEWRLTGAGR